MSGDHPTRAEILSRIAALRAQLAQLDAFAPTAAPTPFPGQGGRPGNAPALWNWLPIPIFVSVIVLLAILRLEGVWLPYMLLLVLNITFLTLIAWLVSFLAARSFLAGQSRGALCLGCGALALGLGAALAALVSGKGDPNSAISIYNSAACLAGLCHLAGAIAGSAPVRPPRRSGWRMLLVSYLGVIALVAGLSALVAAHRWPVYFVQGTGETTFGLVALSVSIALFAVSAILFCFRRGQAEAKFFRWYALGLGLVAVGLAGVSLEANLGDALNWGGRTAQYLGGVYMLIAALSSARQGGTWALPLEQALHEVQERYRRLVELSPDAILVHASGRYLFANAAAARLFGARTSDEMVGVDVMVHVHPDDRAVVAQRVAQAREGMATPRRELRFIRLDGSPFDVEVSGVGVEFDGQPAVLTVMRDISERIQTEQARARAEAALRQSEERFRLVLANSPITVSLMDTDLRYTWVHNPAIPATPTEFVGQRAEDMMPPESVAELSALRRAVLESGIGRRQELCIPLPDGPHWYDMSIEPARDAAGQVVGVSNVAMDITERVRAERARALVEEALRDTSERLQAYLESTPLAVLEWDAEYRLIRWSGQAERIFGWSAEEVLGKTIDDLHLVPEDERARVNQLVAEMRSGHLGTNIHPNRNQRKDGAMIHCEWYNSPTLDAAGRFVSQLALALDVTQRVQSEEALRLSEERFATIFRAAPVPMALSRQNDGLVLDVNEAWVRLFGFAREEALGHTSAELGQWLDPTDRAAMLHDLRPTGSFRDLQLKLRTKGGEARDLLVSSATTLVQGQQVILSALRDISARVRAEAALQESEERLRHVLENARDIIFGRNLSTGRYDYFSPAVEALTGYTVDEVTSMGPEQTIALIHPADRENYVTSTRAVIASNEPSPADAIEYRWLTRSGAYRWFSMTRRLVRDGPGHAAALIGTIRDIHEGKMLEQERYTTLELLRIANNAASSAEMMRAVLSYLRNWLGLDALGIRLRQGDDYPYLETLGFPEQFVQAERHLCVRTPQNELLRDASGNPVLACMCGNVLCGHFDSTKPFFTAYGSFWTNSTSELLVSATEAEWQARTRERCNGEGYESVALIPLRASGETLGLLQLNDHHKGCFTPHLITFLEQTADEIARTYAEKRAREALRELNATLEARVETRTAELQQRTEQLRQLAGELTRAEERERRRVAQVLHDDLQQVLVAARLSLHGLLAAPAVAQAARRVDGLLVQSIGISRSLTAQLSPPVLYELGLIAGLQWLAAWIEQNQHLRVALQADPQAEPQEEDMRALLFQCIRELLLNASKHAGVEHAQVSLTRIPGPCIQVTVSDAGVGFDPAQVASGQSLSGGMGLFSLRERLSLIGGAMEIRSAPGQGTSVTLRVPLRGAPARATLITPGIGTAVALPAASGKAAHVRRVLVADDHAVVRQGIASLLDAEADIEVVGQAEDGLRAVELARELHPDVILMDITMPRLGGIEATQRILAALPETRILALTMHEDPALEAAMRQAGAVGYLSKSGPAEALLAAIRGTR